MRAETNTKIIVGLIIKEIFDEISADEKNRLDSWIHEDAENQIVYNRIRQSSNFSTWSKMNEVLDMESDWNQVLEGIKQNKIRKFRQTFLKYAAAILLPVCIGLGWYYNSQPEKNIQDKFAQGSILHPGSSKAVLVLTDGKSVDLNTSEELSIKEADGTTIVKASGTLNYKKLESGKEKKAIFNTIIIPRGGEYNLTLADGTHVYLNAMSQIRYPVQFVGNTREIELSGEAYFEVSKDASKPFIVKVNGMSVEVLGTKFNVNAYENSGKVVTTLAEGKVKVQSNDLSAPASFLNPSEQAIFNLIDGKTEVSKVDVDLYIGWKDGRLVFHDARMEDIMTTLSRWYSADVFYRSPSIKEIRFSGNLDRTANIRQILDIISSTDKVKIEINNNDIVISDKR